jgi:hypothetical protein
VTVLRQRRQRVHRPLMPRHHPPEVRLDPHPLVAERTVHHRRPKVPPLPWSALPQRR